MQASTPLFHIFCMTETRRSRLLKAISYFKLQSQSLFFSSAGSSYHSSTPTFYTLTLHILITFGLSYQSFFSCGKIRFLTYFLQVSDFCSLISRKQCLISHEYSLSS